MTLPRKPRKPTVYRCKSREHVAHSYTVCPACGCQYCARTWVECPRANWHPAHGATAAEQGERWQALHDTRVGLDRAGDPRREARR